MNSPPYSPLAERMRPQHLQDYVGQSHILGNGTPLRLALEAGRIHSMIFWGASGTGKTTLARLIATHSNALFIALSAVLSGVKEIREAIAQAKAVHKLEKRRTILFVDEVHRFKKAVKFYINKILIEHAVRFLVLPHCSMGVKHG